MPNDRRKQPGQRRSRARPPDRAPAPTSPAVRRAASQLSPRPPTLVERYRVWILGGLAAVVIVAIIVIVALKAGSGGSSAPSTAAQSTPAASTLIAEVTGVPAATLDAVGRGTASGTPKAISGASPLQQDGKPEVLYVGAEFCPFCAAQRWPLIVALSRFGTFSNLRTTHSASNDVYPNTPTFSFYGSTYTSQYLTFTPVETETNQPASGGGYTSLQQLSAEQQATFRTYNAPPYVPAQSQGAIPFTDYGNKYLASGSMYVPDLLKGMTQQQVIDALNNPSSAQAKAILGSANLVTATICQITNGQPGDVCGAAGVKAAAALLGK